MKKFYSEEALELRFTLQVMFTTHLLYILLFRASYVMAFIDMALAYVSYKAIVALEKPKIFMYMGSLGLLFCVGMTHVPNRAAFASGYHQLLFLLQIVFYLVAAGFIGTKFKGHCEMQEVIRIFNDN